MTSPEPTPRQPQVIVTWKLACKHRSQSLEQHTLVELLYCFNSCVSQQRKHILYDISTGESEGILFSQIGTHKKRTLLFELLCFLGMLEKLASVFCHVSTVSIPKCSSEDCAICLTVRAISQPSKASCSKLQLYVSDTGVQSSMWKYKWKEDIIASSDLKTNYFVWK